MKTPRIVALATLYAYLLGLLPFAALAETSTPVVIAVEAPKADAARNAVAADIAGAAVPGATSETIRVAGAELALAPLSRDAEPRAAQAPLELSHAEALATAASGAVLELEGVKLEIPAGAVTQDTLIRITALSRVPGMDEGIANATEGAAGYRFEPHGTEFLVPAKLSMPFDKALASSKLALSNLKTYYFDEELKRWESLRKVEVDADSCVVVSETDHFTDMINGTLTLPEGPAEIAFDPNSIKNLEAADPSSGVMKLEGLTPGNTGAASFSMALRLPPGRGGASPSVALSYSSEGGNGWLGRGFDIQIPTVTIDTRKTPPKFDGNDQYSLNGEALLQTEVSGDVSSYRPRIERAYQKIRHTRSATADYWTVTEKNGTEYEYGQAEGWNGSNRSDRRTAFMWHLTKVRDTFDNTVTYTYRHDEATRQVYLETIQWAGREGSADAGAYRLRFVNEGRLDKRLDGRGGWAAKMAERLKTIELYYRNEVVRTWVLGYRENDYGESLNEMGQSQVSYVAETDGSVGRNEFYRYGFEYEGLEKRYEGETFVGYDAFAAEAPYGQAMGLAKSFQSSVNFSVGGSLGLELSVSIWVPFKKINILKIGVNGGISGSLGYSIDSMQDINGDGRLDLIWKDGSDLCAYLNTENGFDTETAYRNAALRGEYLDYETSFSTSLGISAGVLAVSGGITWQDTWTGSKTGWLDIDGDGLQDFVVVGQSTYMRNTGTGFEEQPFLIAGGGGQTVAPEQDGEYQKAYFVQEPLRKWESPSAGRVSVRQAATVPAGVSSDGVALRTYLRGQGTALTAITGSYDDTAGPAISRDVSAQDAFFFHEDVGVDERGDDVQWNVNIRYERAPMFAGLRETGIFEPPATFGTVPDGMGGIYTLNEETGIYVRKTDWEASATQGVYDALIANGYCLPRYVPREAFWRSGGLAGLLAVYGSIQVGDTNEQGQPTGGTISVTYLELFLGCYGYDRDHDRYVRREGVAWPQNELANLDAVMRVVLQGGSLSASYKRELGMGSLVPGREGMVTSAQGTYTVMAPPEELPRRIDPGHDYAGNKDPELGYPIGATYDGEGNAEPFETVWLRPDGDEWDLVKVIGGEEGAASYIAASESAAQVSVEYVEHEVTRRAWLYEKTSDLESLPEDLYEGRVSDAVLGTRVFLDGGIDRIPLAHWLQIYPFNPPAEDLALVARKAALDGAYELLDGAMAATLKASAAASAIRAAYAVVYDAVVETDTDDTSFDRFLGDGNQGYRIVGLTETEYAAFVAFAGSGAALWFDSVTLNAGLANEEVAYYQKPRLGVLDREALTAAMRLFARDCDLYPYYTHNAGNGLWERKAGLSEGQRSAMAAVLSGAGIYAYGRRAANLSYSVDAWQTVERTTLPSGGTIDARFRNLAGPAAAGSNVGRVTYPMITGGKVWLARSYLPEYDSALDYRAESSFTPAEGTVGARLQPNDPLVGGLGNWYYGFWSGYYDWDEGKLNANPNAGRSGSDTSVYKPMYCSGATKNEHVEELSGVPSVVKTIELDGRSTVAVPDDALIGNDSTLQELSKDGSATLTYTYASYIAGSSLRPRRKGGDAYWKIPRQSGGGIAGGSLSALRESHTKAMDVNGGVSIGPVGGSVSENSGTSWQYAGAMDLNGDRYPDYVSIDDKEGGDGSAKVNYGTGSGFGASEDLGLAIPYLARYENKSYAVGATLGASTGAQESQTSSSGKVKMTRVASSDGASVSGGVSGTYGYSSQTVGFMDVNGDGLLDQVRREGGGGYEVALNLGPGGFSSAQSWGAGETADVDDIGFSVRGMSYSLSMSYGKNLGVTIPIAAPQPTITGTISAAVGTTQNTTPYALMDISGDGLPDQVLKLSEDDYFSVRLNLGDSFSTPRKWYRPDWDENFQNALLNRVDQDIQTIQEKLNLGLPRGISLGQAVSGAINAVSPLGVNPLVLNDTVGSTAGVSFSLSGNLTIDIMLFPGLVYLTLIPGLNGCVAATNSSLSLNDVDGDGLPDHILKLPGADGMKYKRNLAGRAGLLSRIIAPQGGTQELEYEQLGNTVPLPQSKYVLSGVTKDSGAGSLASDRGVQRYAQSFAYSGGYYDRAERDFFGFRQVEARVPEGDGNITLNRTVYRNDDYWTKGTQEYSETREDAASIGGGRLIQRKDISVQKYPAHTTETTGSYEPRVTQETTIVRDPESGNEIETSIGYTLFDDAYGNIERYVDYGGPGIADDIMAEIVYGQKDLAAYIVDRPTLIRVSNGGQTLRLRRGSYGDHGELTLHEASPDGTRYEWSELGYDEYGNLSSVMDSGGTRNRYYYDEDLHALCVRTVTDNATQGGPSYETNATWDPRSGSPLTRVDVNGQTMSYAYDAFGRLTDVRSPYDTGTTPAVSYAYRTGSFPWSARTENKLLYGPADQSTMPTILTVDGLGRALQTAKRGEVREENGDRTEGWNASGAVAYDVKGRAVAQGQSVFIIGTAEPGLAGMLRATTTSYDSQDRPITTSLPDGTTMSSQYRIEGGRYAETSIDPKGNRTVKTADARGNVLEMLRQNAALATLMRGSYGYDALGQMLTARTLKANGSDGGTISAAYDLLGRRTSLESPETGRIDYYYDASGNLERKTDPNLRKRGKSVQYEYDSLDRLVRIDYPWMTDVTYVYGGPEAASTNGAGRILSRTDESGTTSYAYGSLGETASMTRSINRLTPMAGSQAATLAYEWDYLGRLQNITYPDGERVSYGYDAGGNIQSVQGAKPGANTTYVTDIAYDEFGERIYIEYGNGTRTSYEYDEDRRWLDRIRTTTSWGSVLQNIEYRFDEQGVGNIAGYRNETGTFTTEQSYGYDDLYQLTSATGTSVYAPTGQVEYTSTYRQTFSFDELGNMLNKVSTMSSTSSAPLGDNLNYSLDYQYYAGTHKAERAGDIYYAYDLNGNLVEARQGGHSQAVIGTLDIEAEGDLRRTAYGFGLSRIDEDEDDAWKRSYEWDEENRLKKSIEGETAVDYRYDADGQRALKYSSSGESMYFDSFYAMTTTGSELRASKHVFVGETRIATRLYIEGDPTVGYELENTYYYHTDHLGSASLITDPDGLEYERIEYTPYGELWIEKTRESFNKIPFRFTGKELDPETGLYYFGARYLDPKTSVWLSADPALGDYFSKAPIDDEAKKANKNLPGMGGVYNLVNLQLYHYAGNNPVKYTDPDGNALTTVNKDLGGTAQPKSGMAMTPAFPDVCKTPTPSGPVPIPYPNIAKSSDTATGSKKVKADGSAPSVKGSTFSMSTGDEAGTLGGVVSGSMKGKAEFMNYSFDIQFEGKNVPRLGGMMLQPDGPYSGAPKAPSLLGPQAGAGAAQSSAAPAPLVGSNAKGAAAANPRAGAATPSTAQGGPQRKPPLPQPTPQSAD